MVDPGRFFFFFGGRQGFHLNLFLVLQKSSGFFGRMSWGDFFLSHVFDCLILTECYGLILIPYSKIHDEYFGVAFLLGVFDSCFKVGLENFMLDFYLTSVQFKIFGPSLG